MIPHYTIASIIAACVSLLVDRILGTQLYRRKEFWIFLGMMSLLMLLVNGYLTGRPVVVYGEAHVMGVRLGTIPLEDFLYGFSFLTAIISVWEKLR